MTRLNSDYYGVSQPSIFHLVCLKEARGRIDFHHHIACSLVDSVTLFRRLLDRNPGPLRRRSPTLFRSKRTDKLSFCDQSTLEYI